MARPTLELVHALRATSQRLRGDAAYQWGHMGACNCGNLVQTITGLSKQQIHSWAMEQEGDWEQQAHDYCPTSGRRIDDVISAMLALGMSLDDVGHLEKLSDPEVLARLPKEPGEASTGPGRRYLRRHVREDVILYMETWADLLEARIPAAARASAA